MLDYDLPFWADDTNIITLLVRVLQKTSNSLTSKADDVGMISSQCQVTSKNKPTQENDLTKQYNDWVNKQHARIVEKQLHDVCCLSKNWHFKHLSQHHNFSNQSFAKKTCNSLTSKVMTKESKTPNIRAQKNNLTQENDICKSYNECIKRTTCCFDNDRQKKQIMYIC